MNQLAKYHKFALEMLVLGTNWKTRHSVVCQQTCKSSHKNGLRHATDDWQDSIHTFIAQMNSDKIVMWATQLSIVDWVYSKTQTLLATFRTRNQPQRESYVSSEVEHLSPSVGCARSKHLSPTLDLLGHGN